MADFRLGANRWKSVEVPYFFGVKSPDAKSDSNVGLEEPKADNAARIERIMRLIGTDRGDLSKFAKSSGIPLSTLRSQLGSGGMGLDAAVDLARALKVNLRWLATGLGPQLLGEGEIIPPRSAVAPELPEGYVVVPRYEARAGAGRGVVNPSDRIVEQMVVSEEYIRRRLRRRPEDMTLVEALGDSMSPTIQDGDVMMVDISVTELRASAVYILLRDHEELAVKRLHRMTDGRILVISDNDRYPREEITPSDRSPIQIVGQVVWYGRPMAG